MHWSLANALGTARRRRFEADLASPITWPADGPLGSEAKSRFVDPCAALAVAQSHPLRAPDLRSRHPGYRRRQSSARLGPGSGVRTSVRSLPQLVAISAPRFVEVDGFNASGPKEAPSMSSRGHAACMERKSARKHRPGASSSQRMVWNRKRAAMVSLMLLCPSRTSEQRHLRAAPPFA
jgi:hypothetical protein